MDTSTPNQTTRPKSSKEKVDALQKLPWPQLQIAGELFADALEFDNINPTADQLADLILLTARLLEFTATVKGILYDDTDSLSYAS